MSDEKKSSPWVWLSLIVIVTLFAGFILFLDQEIVKSGRQSERAAKPGGNSAEPVIDFYTILQDRKLDVPVPKSKSVDNVPQQSTATQQRHFILQAGSFRKATDADRRKAELALLGLEAAIKKAQVDGIDYHRVELGPFSDDGFYSQVRNRLISNDIAFIAKSPQ